jgi:hypothetical protein
MQTAASIALDGGGKALVLRIARARKDRRRFLPAEAFYRPGAEDTRPAAASRHEAHLPDRRMAGLLSHSFLSARNPLASSGNPPRTTFHARTNAQVTRNGPSLSGVMTVTELRSRLRVTGLMA